MVTSLCRHESSPPPGPPTVCVQTLPAEINYQSTTAINGSGFTGATSVHFGVYIPLVWRVLSDSRIDVNLSYQGPPTGWVDVTVTTPAGTSATNPSSKFYWAPLPVVTSVSPTSAPHGGGTTVHISGRNFIDIRSVAFACYPQCGPPGFEPRFIVSYAIVSSTEMVVVSPNVGAALNGAVIVVTLGGMAAAPFIFT